MVLRRTICWIVVVILVISAAVVGVGGWIACERGIHPELLEDKYKLSDFDLPVEKVHFKSRDGLRLAGWFIPGSNGATVVLAHGKDGDRTWMLPDARYLHRDGFSVLMFDFRYHGESEGGEFTLGAKEPLDIEGAVDYLTTRRDVDSKRIGVQGNSLGAASAILAAAQTPEIKGVVGESPFKSLSSVIDHSFREFVRLPRFPFAPATKLFCELRLGIDIDDVAPVNVISKLSPRPILLIDDLEDDLFPRDSVEVLYKAAREPKDLWQITGCPHGIGWECARKEYEQRVLGFWRQTFGILQSN